MNREWMYRRSTSKGDFSPQFLHGLESFIEFACSKPAFMDGENIRCPCRKCQNRYFRDVETVRAHVKKKGFEFNYKVWVFQGESRVSDQFQHTVVGDRGASNQYSDMVSSAKRKRMNEGRPPFVPESVWSTWCAHWDSKEAQAVSVRAKKNRLSEPDGDGTGQIRHLGGSRSAAAHAIALESGGSVGENLYATFRRYHFKNGVWSDKKSQRIGDEVDRRLEEARQPLPDGTLPPPVDPNAIYLEVIGGPNSKNRIFGIGSLYSGSQSATSPAGCSPLQPFTSVGLTPEQIHEQIQQQVQEQLAAQKAVYETLLKESQDKFHEDISALRSTMMDFITHGSQPPPGSGSGS